jgi:hypothetical protein
MKYATLLFIFSLSVSCKEYFGDKNEKQEYLVKDTRVYTIYKVVEAYQWNNAITVKFLNDNEEETKLITGVTGKINKIADSKDNTTWLKYWKIYHSNQQYDYSYGMEIHTPTAKPEKE